MSWALFKADIKANRFVWILLTLVLLMYFLIMSWIFDPLAADKMETMLEMFPKAMIDAIGFKVIGTSLLAFLAGYLYGFVILVFPIILVIVVNQRLVAGHVDRGSMAFILASPLPRSRIAFTQAAFSLASITGAFAAIVAATIAACAAMRPGELDVGGFLMLNVHTLSMYFALSGICFLASCAANESRTSLGAGAGVVGFFILVKMVSGAADSLGWLKYLTLLSLFDPDAAMAGDAGAMAATAAYLAVAAALYAGGIVVFSRKDMPV